MCGGGTRQLLRHFCGIPPGRGFELRQIKRAVQGIEMANATPLVSFEAQNVEVLPFNVETAVKATNMVIQSATRDASRSLYCQSVVRKV